MAIVVGSGAGGATMAKELAAAGHSVLVIEKGSEITETDAHQHYANVDAEVKLMRTCCLGGTTMVSGGNALRCLEAELKALGIDLCAEFEEAEREMGVRELPDELIGEGTRRLVDAAAGLGFSARKMPKFIDPERCCIDGRCSLGCPASARWTAVRFVDSARCMGARVITGQAVTAVTTKHGEVSGVQCGSEVYEDDLVIIAAGALESPRLIEPLGIPTTPLFCDTFVTIGGICPGIGFDRDIPMGAYITHDSCLVMPHFSRQLVSLLQERGWPVGPGDILAMMVKIADEGSGSAGERIEKGVTARDGRLLSSGASVAGAILAESGVNPETFVAAPLRGPHPRGTARIGVSVDKTLMTRIAGLYIADASVLPRAPGAPPILTIVALAKYAARLM